MSSRNKYGGVQSMALTQEFSLDHKANARSSIRAGITKLNDLPTLLAKDTKHTDVESNQDMVNATIFRNHKTKYNESWMDKVNRHNTKSTFNNTQRFTNNTKANKTEFGQFKTILTDVKRKGKEIAANESVTAFTNNLPQSGSFLPSQMNTLHHTFHQSSQENAKKSILVKNSNQILG